MTPKVYILWNIHDTLLFKSLRAKILIITNDGLKIKICGYKIDYLSFTKLIQCYILI